MNFVAAAAAVEEGSPLAFPWVLVGVPHVFRCTIVRPTAPTHLRNPRLKVTECGLACAAAAERAKHAKYDALCKQRKWKMIPFAMESHGAVGESARRLLFQLASKVSDISAQAFLQQTYARLSVALQSANAAIMVGGLQRL